MSARHSTPTRSNRAVAVVIALIASLLVLASPNLESKANYLSFDTSAITYNDRVCNLGDPNNHTTSDTAFEISTSEQLWEITDCVSNTATIYFELGDDIDVSDASKAGSAPTNSPIGFSTSALAYSFRGVLDGAGRSIKNVSMSSSTYGVGLFAALQNATVSNLIIHGDFVTTNTGTTTTMAAGALAITTIDTVMLRNLTNSSSVSGFANVGGLVGYAQNLISFESVRNDGTVRGESVSVGGLIGLMAATPRILGSSNTGAVFGITRVGGLIGNLPGVNAEIVDSSNSGTVTGTVQFVGGLVGHAQGNGVLVMSSSNTGRVDGGANAGGLLGHCGGVCSAHGASNTGQISASEKAGGLVGFGITVSIYDSFNTGTVSATSQQAGGLVGYADNPTIERSHNSARVSGTQSVGGLVGWTLQILKIDSSQNTGEITGSLGSVGGLGGWLQNPGGSAQITKSHNTGSVFGSNQVGGLMGYVNGDTNLDSSSNTGPVSGTGFDVGGLVGYAKSNANINSSYNTGPVSGTLNRVGGLVGLVEQNVIATITSSYNIGAVRGRNEVGGLVGLVRSDVRLTSSYNIGTVSGAQYVGGLMGYARSNANIDSSYNTGPVSGSAQVGGLVGIVVLEGNINSSYNTGEVSGTGNVIGGLVGIAQADAIINSSYNTGAVTGNNDFDGLAGSVQGSVTTTSAYSSVASRYVTARPANDMKLASTFVGFDFSSSNPVWGFGSPIDNQGFPMLRVFAELSSYFSDFARFSSNSELGSLVLSQGVLSPTFASATTNYVVSLSNDVSAMTLTPVTSDSDASITVEGSAVASGNESAAISLIVGTNTITILITAADSTTTSYTLTVFRSNPPSQPEPEVEAESRPAVYLGPVLNGPMETHAGALVVFSGRRLETISRALVQETQITIVLSSPKSLVLEIPSSMSPGSYDLRLQSSFGLLTFQKGLRVLENASTAIVIEALDKKLTVGAFKGFIAIYTKGYEGQRLSAKVAGKWLVVSSLDETWSGNNYSRTIRSTGAGKSIKVHLYIDRQFVRTEELRTK